MTRPEPSAAQPADADAPTTVQATRRAHLNEDWLATITGLVLLGLVLTGTIGAGVIP